MKKQTVVGLIGLLSLLFTCGGLVQAEGLTGGGDISFEGSDPLLGVLDPETQTGVDPGTVAKTDGALRIDFAPQLTFVTTALTNKELHASAQAQLFHGGTPPRGTFVQVSDYREVGTGWTLLVRQEQQFRHETQAEVQLKGATISFDKAWTNSTKDPSLAPKVSKEVIQMNNVGESYPLAQAGLHEGLGTWSISFGASAENQKEQPATLEPVVDTTGKPVTDPDYDNQAVYQNQAVNLTIPATETLVAGNYSTVLTWVLAELP